MSDFEDETAGGDDNYDNNNNSDDDSDFYIPDSGDSYSSFDYYCQPSYSSGDRFCSNFRKRTIKDITNPIENEKAKCFSDINEILLELFKDEKEKEEEKVLSKIILLFSQDCKNFKMIMGLFNVFFSIRPKEKSFLINLISSLYALSPIFKDSFVNYAKQKKDDDLLNLFLNKNPEILHNIQNNVKQQSIILYENGPIKTAIINDDFDTLQSLTYDENKFNFLCSTKPFYEFLKINKIRKMYFRIATQISHWEYKIYTKDNFFPYTEDEEHYYDEHYDEHSIGLIQPLEFIAFYGSVKSFKYFLLNDAIITSKKLNKYAIAGGNLEIIHILEQRGISFDNCLNTSITFHRNEISNWLMDNYKCQDISFKTAIRSYNFPAFFFLYLNRKYNVERINGDHYSDDFTCYMQDYIMSESCIYQMIDFLINIGADIKRQTKFGFSIIYDLCLREDLDIDLIKYLIEKGAYFDDSFGLICTHNSPNIELIKFFINHGVDINQKYNLKYHKLLPFIKSDYIFPKLKSDHILPNLKSDSILPNLKSREVIKILIENGADVNLLGSDGQTILSKAILYDSPFDREFIEYLIQHGGDVNTLIPFEEPNIHHTGKLPLLYNLCNLYFDPSEQRANIIEKIKFLISKGANCNIGPFSPLFPFCCHDPIHFDMIELLINNGADVNYGEIDSFSSLCRQKSLKFKYIKLFINKGVKISSEILNELIARGYRDYQTFEYIISKRGVKALTGISILPLCDDKSDNSKLFHLLVEKTPKLDDTEPSLSYFCKKPSLDIPLIKQLIDKGANINLESPILDLIQRKDASDDIIKYLVDKGANLNFGDNPPLNILLHKETLNLNLIKYLAEKGADVNYECKCISKDSSKDCTTTPFKEICNHNCLTYPLFSVFIENGADFHKIDPLYNLFANPKCTVEMIKLLQQKGYRLPFFDIMNSPYRNWLNTNSKMNYDVLIYLFLNGRKYDENGIRKKWTEFEMLQFFDLLCQHHNFGAVKKYIDFGFNPNTYHLLIHSYYKFGFSRKIIETLLSKGADINQTDGKNTLLSILCKDIKTNFESVKYLVSHGAKISDQDINNASKNPACANYLRKRKDMKK